MKQRFASLKEEEMRTSVSRSAEGRGGNRKFQGFFGPIWLSEESGKMKGQDVGGRTWLRAHSVLPPIWRLLLLGFTC